MRSCFLFVLRFLRYSSKIRSAHLPWSFGVSMLGRVPSPLALETEVLCSPSVYPGITTKGASFPYFSRRVLIISVNAVLYLSDFLFSSLPFSFIMSNPSDLCQNSLGNKIKLHTSKGKIAPAFSKKRRCDFILFSGQDHKFALLQCDLSRNSFIFQIVGPLFIKSIYKGLLVHIDHHQHLVLPLFSQVSKGMLGVE